MLFDTHFHPFHTKDMIHLKKNDSLSLENVIKNAQKEDVSYLMAVSTDLEDSLFNYDFSTNSNFFYSSIGIHPCDTIKYGYSLEKIKNTFDSLIKKDQFKKIKAVGEIGLDLYHDQTHLKDQITFFKYQIEYALSQNLSIIIHSRNATEETLKILDEYKDSKLKGIIHCFADSFDIAQEFIKRDFVLGIGAYITYPKNEVIRNTIKQLNLEHYVLETDAPFLPPQHLRGTINEPLHIKTVADFIAKMINSDLTTVATKTTSLAKKIFNIE